MSLNKIIYLIIFVKADGGNNFHSFGLIIQYVSMLCVLAEEKECSLGGCGSGCGLNPSSGILSITLVGGAQSNRKSGLLGGGRVSLGS